LKLPTGEGCADGAASGVKEGPVVENADGSALGDTDETIVGMSDR